jgi:hypothetical protein
MITSTLAMMAIGKTKSWLRPNQVVRWSLIVRHDVKLPLAAERFPNRHTKRVFPESPEPAPHAAVDAPDATTASRCMKRLMSY